MPQDDIASFPQDHYVTVTGRIDDEPRVIEDIVLFTLRAESVGQRRASGLISVMARSAELEYGDKVEIRGKLEDLEGLANPGLLSFADYLEKKGIRCRLNAARSPPKLLAKGGSLIKKLSISLKDRLIIVPQKTLPEPYATLLASIVFGSRAASAPPEIKETYKRAGVAHLLVASGMHLGILIGVCLFLVRSSRLPLWLGILVTSLVNFLYALMTGFGPSILRAAIMAEIMLVGLLFEREKEIYTSLSLAALVILFFNPQYLFDVGFQLSFAATLSLVYVAPVLAEKLKTVVPRFVATLLSAAVAPVLISIPITLFHFSQASLIGVLTNILLLPWIGTVVVLGFVSTVLGAFFLPLGELINGANLILLWAAHRTIGLLASLPFAQIYLAPPGLPLVMGYYAGLAVLVEVIRRWRLPRINKFRLTVVGLAVAALLFWNAALSAAGGGLTVTVLDVGQGDSILVESPGGRTMLIDAGERQMGEKVVVPFLRKNGINKLDMVVLTHPHEDHVGGLPAVLEKIKVEAVLEPGFDYNSQSYRRFLELVEKNKIKYHLARAGQKINLGQAVRAAILHPTLPFDENLNNVSVVLRLSCGDFSMMLTGDNEKEGEEKILETFSASRLASTVLKAGHHGSATSTSDPFLQAVNPQAAIISCGRRNKFKHPHQVTLQKLQGIKTYRTDLNGAVVIRSNGKTYSVQTGR